VNTRENRLYLRSREKPAGISVPMLIEYVRVSGEVQEGTDEDVVVENLHFKGLVFTKGKRYTWDKDLKQINWYGKDVLLEDVEAENLSASLLRFRNTKNCSVRECLFENSGADGIRLDLTSQGNRVDGNHIRRLGGTAVSLSGYRPGRKDANFGNEVTGNHIHHTGEAYWGAPAISICQSGTNRIAHNLIHHVPYNGLHIWGTNAEGNNEGIRNIASSVRSNPEPLYSRDNIIEYNELHHVVEVLGDGNAFYVGKIGGNDTYRYNYIHDMTGSHASSAIRTDGVGTAKNMSFIGNIVQNVRRGGLVLKGAGHKAINNIFVDCYGDSLGKGWEGGMGWFEIRCGPSEGTVLKNNIFYTTDNKNPNFMLAKFKMPARFRKKNLVIELDKVEQAGNICYSTILDQQRGEEVVKETSRKQGFELEYRKIAAISFEDGRIVLDPNDNLFKDGYEYIDISKIGLPETFPKEWLAYDSVMSMKRYFE
jgi:hypothetical protein